MVEFIQADLGVHRALLVDLNEEYLGWIVGNLQKLYGIDAMSIVHQTVRQYAERTIDEIAVFVPPEGIFYLLKEGENAIGMGDSGGCGRALRRSSECTSNLSTEGKGLARRCCSSF